MAGSSYRRIGPVTKAVQILKHLANQKQPVTGAEIAKAIGEAPGTVVCYLATLADDGMLEQVGDGWQVGMGIALIWARVKSNLEAQRDRCTRDIDRLETGR
jgi:DNA-binding IclR family transcriptional regulator